MIVGQPRNPIEPAYQAVQFAMSECFGKAGKHLHCVSGVCFVSSFCLACQNAQRVAIASSNAVCASGHKAEGSLKNALGGILMGGGAVQDLRAGALSPNLTGAIKKTSSDVDLIIKSGVAKFVRRAGHLDAFRLKVLDPVERQIYQLISHSFT